LIMVPTPTIDFYRWATDAHSGGGRSHKDGPDGRCAKTLPIIAQVSLPADSDTSSGRQDRFQAHD
jgi:hypothetical protein